METDQDTPLDSCLIENHSSPRSWTLRREISSSLEDGFQSKAIELSNISRAIDFDDESKGDNEVEEFLNNDNENKDSYFLSNLFNAFSPVSSSNVSSSNPRYSTPSIKLIYNKVENYRNEFIHKEKWNWKPINHKRWNRNQ